MSAVCTAGYEGASLDRWIKALIDARVETVVDVRELPLSRRKGFSKSSLATRLNDEGIEYVHIRTLGNPPELRHALKDNSMAFVDFVPLFREQLANRREDIQRAAELAEQKRVCLVCFEEDPATCHRSLVAESLAAASSKPLIVEHLRHVGST